MTDKTPSPKTEIDVVAAYADAALAHLELSEAEKEDDASRAKDAATFAAICEKHRLRLSVLHPRLASSDADRANRCVAVSFTDNGARAAYEEVANALDDDTLMTVRILGKAVYFAPRTEPSEDALAATETAATGLAPGVELAASKKTKDARAKNRKAREDAEKAAGDNLTVLHDGHAIKMLHRLFEQYVQDDRDDFRFFIDFMRKVDQLLVDYRKRLGNKAARALTRDTTDVPAKGGKEDEGAGDDKKADDEDAADPALKG